jgi:hypothetical protein
LEDAENSVRVDFIDALGADSAAVGFAEDHLPLGDMPFVPEFGFVAVDVFVREGTKYRNGKFRHFVGFLMLQGVSHSGKQSLSSQRPFSYRWKRDLASVNSFSSLIGALLSMSEPQAGNCSATS